MVRSDATSNFADLHDVAVPKRILRVGKRDRSDRLPRLHSIPILVWFIFSWLINLVY